MQFIGTSVWDWEGKVACKVRNRTSVYVVPSSIFLDKYKDFRYVEFYLDQAGNVQVKRPVGKQFNLERPYTLVWREGIEGGGAKLVSKEVS